MGDAAAETTTADRRMAEAMAELLLMLDGMIDDLHRERARVNSRHWWEVWNFTAKRNALSEVAYRLRTGRRHTRWAFSDMGEAEVRQAVIGTR